MSLVFAVQVNVLAMLLLDKTPVYHRLTSPAEARFSLTAECSGPLEAKDKVLPNSLVATMHTPHFSTIIGGSGQVSF